MNHTIKPLLVVALVGIVGCTPKVIKMDADTIESLDTPQEIHTVHYKSARFEMPPHPVGRIFGAIAGAIATHIQEGQIVEDYGLQDPILLIKKRFTGEALKKYSKMQISEISEPLDDDDIDNLKERFTNGSILDFQTIRWGLVKPKEGFVRSHAFSSYHNPKYLARVRLINVSSGKVLWQGVCDLENQNSISTADFENFGQGKGNFLEGTFNNLASQCLNTPVKQFTHTSPS